MSITPNIVMICIDIQGEEHHCQEEHHQSNEAMISGNSWQDKNNLPIEMRVLMATRRDLITLYSCYGRADWESHMVGN
jgi:hypothetical protein